MSWANTGPKPKRDLDELKRLYDEANNALFNLHDYMRRVDGEDDHNWLSVYKARVDADNAVGWTKQRWTGILSAERYETEREEREAANGKQS